MLNFFRKHQKIFFIFVTVMIVISFTFFGTFNTFMNQEKTPDYTIGYALDGSAIMSSDVELMNRFLKDGLQEGGKAVNLLNGSAIHQQFLSTGLAEILVERYWDDLKDDLESRFRKAKHFTPYVHPQAPFLSSKVVWERFCPEMNPLLNELSAAEDTLTPQSFSLLLKLYLAQTKLPAHMLKQVLLHQQKQYSCVCPDPNLMHEEPFLFGFTSLEEWFGPKFMHLISQFLINAAVYAEQNGVHLSKEEARAEMLLNAQQGLEFFAQGKQISLAEAGDYYYGQLQSLRIEESKAIKVWKRVMAFKRLFQEGAAGILLDKTALAGFHSYARECASVELYQLPEAMRLSDSRSLAKFQLYLEAIACNTCGNTAMPSSFLHPDYVESKFPELIQRRFELQVAEVKKDDLAQRIGLKETWEWELDDVHFAYLKTEFPILALEPASTRDERFQALEKLTSEIRFKVDQAARRNILNLHPEWLDEALDKAPTQQRTIAIKSKGSAAPFEGVTNFAELAELLENQDHSLKRFSANNETYYRISVLRKSKNKEVLTFAEAMHDGTLETLLNSKSNVDETAATASHRLVDFMKRAQKDVESKKEKSIFLKSETDPFERLPLCHQWMLVKNHKNIKRKKESDAVSTQAFHLKGGEWSSLVKQPDGDLCFFQLLEKKQEKETSFEDIAEAQRPLVLDAQRVLMRQLTDLFQDKKLISMIAHETE